MERQRAAASKLKPKSFQSSGVCMYTTSIQLPAGKQAGMGAPCCSPWGAVTQPWDVGYIHTSPAFTLNGSMDGANVSAPLKSEASSDRPGLAAIHAFLKYQLPMSIAANLRIRRPCDDNARRSLVGRSGMPLQSRYR